MIRLKVGNYRFAPKLIPALAAIVLVPFLISLGLWQLDRADQKKVIDNSVKEAQQKVALNINTFVKNSHIKKENFKQEIYRTASISGHYDNDHQFLLDNRTHKGKAGFHVLTPFILNNTDKAILINRGWITYQGTRDNIPDISISQDTINILGVMKQQARAIVLSNDTGKVNTSYPKLIQSIELAELAKELELELLPIVIELDKKDNTGFIREWQPYYGSIDKHNAYALQWFAMAAILLFLFLKLNTKKIKL